MPPDFKVSPPAHQDWYKSYDMGDPCSNCGQRCGAHHDTNASCPHLYSDGSPDPQRFRTDSKFNKGMPPKKATSGKVYTGDCPCGVPAAHCTYHAAQAVPSHS